MGRSNAVLIVLVIAVRRLFVPGSWRCSWLVARTFFRGVMVRKIQCSLLVVWMVIVTS
jgi:hypothetical protein